MFELYDLENNMELVFVLDVNYYWDVQMLEKKVQLQGKCQLVVLFLVGVIWEMDDNGFVVLVMGKEMKVEYCYDSEGYLLGKIIINLQNMFFVMVKFFVDLCKKLDYMVVSWVDD